MKRRTVSIIIFCSSLREKSMVLTANGGLSSRIVAPPQGVLRCAALMRKRNTFYAF